MEIAKIQKTENEIIRLAYKYALARSGFFVDRDGVLVGPAHGNDARALITAAECDLCCACANLVPVAIQQCSIRQDEEC
jgi:hypothetical protein